ncbi:MAG TPA: hypothetical protein VFQ45_06480 [Longimicrobium sp.]|nr:hypothetical protein [Longimicrobium sp.]
MYYSLNPEDLQVESFATAPDAGIGDGVLQAEATPSLQGPTCPAMICIASAIGTCVGICID